MHTRLPSLGVTRRAVDNRLAILGTTATYKKADISYLTINIIHSHRPALMANDAQEYIQGIV